LRYEYRRRRRKRRRKINCGGGKEAVMRKLLSQRSLQN